MSEQDPQVSLSELTNPVEGHIGGSLTSGIAGEYSFSIRQLIAFGWEKMTGFKGTFWLALLVYIVASLVLNKLAALILHGFGLASGEDAGATITGNIVGWILSVVLGVVTYSLMVGQSMLAIHRAADFAVKPSDVFNYIPQALPIFFTYSLMFVLMFCGFVLLILPGIYLMVGYMLALPLVVEKSLSPWQALEASRKAIHHHWWRAFGLCLAIGGLVVISIFTLGIALIWVMPAVALATGQLYVIVFGIEGRVTA